MINVHVKNVETEFDSDSNLLPLKLFLIKKTLSIFFTNFNMQKVHQ